MVKKFFQFDSSSSSSTPNSNGQNNDQGFNNWGYSFQPGATPFFQMPNGNFPNYGQYPFSEFFAQHSNNAMPNQDLAKFKQACESY